MDTSKLIKKESFITNDNKKLHFMDINDFSRKYRSLKKYCPRSHKYLCFNLLKNIPVDKEGKYIVKVPTDEDFKKIYGQVELVYSVRNQTIVIENLKPEEFLIDGFIRDLDSYKGIPYRNSKDKFKIELIMKMKGAY